MSETLIRPGHHGGQGAVALRRHQDTHATATDGTADAATGTPGAQGKAPARPLGHCSQSFG